MDYQYQLLRCNVDLLKIIQLGLTFMNEDGDYPPGTTTWQFNFKFNLTWVNASHQTRAKTLFFFPPLFKHASFCVVAACREDMYSQDSIDLLQNSGLQFKKHEEEGIDTLYFAELLMTSGLVLCENVKWLSFHRSVVVVAVVSLQCLQCHRTTGSLVRLFADWRHVVCLPAATTLATW